MPRRSLYLVVLAIAATSGIDYFGVHGISGWALLQIATVLLILPLLSYVRQCFGWYRLALLAVDVLVLHALWGTYQFATQRPVGVHLLGETRLSAQTPGVAKFFTSSGKLVRAYGPYPHPNPFGGMLVIGLILLVLAARRMPRSVLVHLLFWLSLGVIISFSRAAWAGGVLSLLWFWYQRRRLRRFLLPVLLAGVVCLPLVGARLFDAQDAAREERLDGIRWTIDLLRETGAWTFGLGSGNFLVSLAGYLTARGVSFQPWQLDYVHSVPLLLFASVGWTGMLVVAVWLWIVYRQRPRGLLYLLPLLPVLLFDHYFVTQPAPAIGLLLAGMLALEHQAAEAAEQ